MRPPAHETQADARWLRLHRLFLLLVLTVWMAQGARSSAATRTWDGGAANDFWATAANWSLNVAPVAGDDLEFSGTPPLLSTNNYPAGFDFGTVTFSAPGHVVRGNALDLTNGITVLGPIGPIEFHPDVTLLAEQTFTVSRFNAALNLRGTLNLNGNTPRIFSAGTVNLFNTVSGGGGLTQDGGTLVLHSNNTFSGTATLNFGTCLVLAANPNINATVNSGATLGGTGSIRRLASTGGTVQPGVEGPGVLQVSATTSLDGASTFAVQLNGTGPGSQYDRLTTVTASLGGATLNVSVGYPMVVGQQFIILETTGGTPVTGTFGGLPEGALFIEGNMQFQITYAGGDGNDVVLTAVAQQPSGISRIWDGGGANNLWTTAANWVGDVAPLGGDTLVFPAGAAQLINVNDYPAGLGFNAIQLNGAGYTLTGNRVALGASAVSAGYPAGTSTVGMDIDLTGNTTIVNFVATSPTLVLSGNLALGPYHASFVCEGPIVLSGAVSGTGSIFKGKNPALRFSGPAANTFTGPASITGLCELAKPAGVMALAGPLNIGNAAGASGEVRLLAQEQISSASTVTVFTAATLNLNGFDETIHSLCLTGGVVTTMSGTLTLLGGVETKPSLVSASIAGNLALGAGADHPFLVANGLAGNDLDVSAVLIGPASARLIKSGSGQMRLSGNAPNSFNGETRVNAGTLLLGKPDNIAAVAGPLVIGDGLGIDVVRLSADDQILDTIALTLTRGGQLDLNGRDDGIGPLSMTGGSIVTGAGLLTLAGHVAAFPSGLASRIDGHLALGPAGNRLFDIAAGANLDIGAVISGGAGLTLVKTNLGQLTLGGANVFNGAVRVAQGALMITDADALGDVTGTTTVSGGMLVVSNAAVVNELLIVDGGTLRGEAIAAWNGDVILNGDAIVSTEFPDVFTFTGLISGPGGFVKVNNGWMRIRGFVPNTFTGTTRVNEGELEIYSFGVVSVSGPLIVGDGIGAPGSVEVRYGGHQQIADTSRVTLNSDGRLTVQGWSDTIGSLAGVGAVDLSTSALALGGDHSADAAYNGVISGSGGITKVGLGTQTLNGNNTYSGSTTVSNGAMIVNGQQPGSAVFIHAGCTLGGNGTAQRVSVLGGGRLSPGASPGVLTTAGFVTFQDSSSLFRVELNGLTPGAGHDQLSTPFAVSLANATLQVAPGFTPAVGSGFVIVNKGGALPVNGTFNGLNEGAVLAAGGLVFAITYAGGDGNDVVLTRVPAPQSQFEGITPIRGGAMRLGGLGVPGLLYTIEFTTSLSPRAIWTTLGTATAGADGSYEIVDTETSRDRMRFYRAQSP